MFANFWLNAWRGAPNSPGPRFFVLDSNTLATGFWIACVAPDEWLRGHGQVHIPSSLPQIVATLPTKARDMLGEVVNSRFVNDPKRTFLADVLDPATHGDALVNAVRIGSGDAQRKNWAQYLSHLMNELTHNFGVLINELAAIDVASIGAKSVPAITNTLQSGIGSRRRLKVLWATPNW